MERLCSLCGSSPASVFCPCSRQETFLCASCQNPHIATNRYIPHPVLPLSVFGLHRSPGFFDRVMARSLGIADGKQSLLAGLAEIEKCEKEFAESINKLVKEAIRVKRTTLQDLKLLKEQLGREVRESIEEADRTLMEEEPTLVGRFSRQLREFDAEKPCLSFSYYLSVCTNVEKLVTFHGYTEEKEVIGLHQACPPCTHLNSNLRLVCSLCGMSISPREIQSNSQYCYPVTSGSCGDIPDSYKLFSTFPVRNGTTEDCLQPQLQLRRSLSENSADECEKCSYPESLPHGKFALIASEISKIPGKRSPNLQFQKCSTAGSTTTCSGEDSECSVF